MVPVLTQGPRNCLITLVHPAWCHSNTSCVIQHFDSISHGISRRNNIISNVYSLLFRTVDMFDLAANSLFYCPSPFVRPCFVLFFCSSLFLFQSPVLTLLTVFHRFHQTFSSTKITPTADSEITPRTLSPIACEVGSSGFCTERAEKT